MDSEQLVNRVIDAHNQDDKEAVESFLCGKSVILIEKYVTFTKLFENYPQPILIFTSCSYSK